MATLSECSASLITSSQPTLAPAKNSRGAKNITHKVIKYLEDGHVNSGELRYHGITILVRTIVLTL